MAFLKKNIQPIVLSCMVSIIAIIALVSFSPYLLKTLTTKKEVIGVAGIYSPNNLPDIILSKISNGLLFINEKGEIIPLLADSWEQLDNGKEFRFHIKKDLLWNNGKPFTANEINYPFKDVETKIVGDYMIVFRLKKPLPVFPNYLTSPVIKAPLIGVAGLYKVEKAKIKFGEVNELELTPNKPGLPILVYKFFDSETKLLNAYKLGEIDQMVLTKKTLADNFAQWKNTEIIRTVDYSQVLTLFFNFNDKLLREDKDIRQSIASTIPTDTFTELGYKSTGPIPPTSWAFDPNVKTIQYDPDKSAKTLGKLPEGSESAQLTISTFYDYLFVAEEIKNNLDRAGLKTRVEVLSENQLGNYDLLLAALQISNDPDQYFYWHSTQKQSNITNYKSVKVDKLLEDGRDTSDLAKRKVIYSNFQKIIADEVPAFFLYYPYIYTIKRK